MVISHDQNAENAVDSTHVVERLSEVELGTATDVFIDELHFFDAAEFSDTIETLRNWYELGVAVFGTTLNKRGDGLDFFQHRLEDASIPCTSEVVRGQCAYAGCTQPSELTARITAFDGNWVGGADKYQPCCEVHFPLMDVFVYPGALIHNWDFFKAQLHTLKQRLEVDQSRLCELLNAAAVALRNGVPLIVA